MYYGEFLIEVGLLTLGRTSARIVRLVVKIFERLKTAAIESLYCTSCTSISSESFSVILKLNKYHWGKLRALKFYSIADRQ